MDGRSDDSVSSRHHLEDKNGVFGLEGELKHSKTGMFSLLLLAAAYPLSHLPQLGWMDGTTSVNVQIVSADGSEVPRALLFSSALPVLQSRVFQPGINASGSLGTIVSDRPLSCQELVELNYEIVRSEVGEFWISNARLVQSSSAPLWMLAIGFPNHTFPGWSDLNSFLALKKFDLGTYSFRIDAFCTEVQQE